MTSESLLTTRDALRNEISVLEAQKSETAQALESVRFANGNAEAAKRLAATQEQTQALVREADAKITVATKRDAESLALHQSVMVRDEDLRKREEAWAEKHEVYAAGVKRIRAIAGGAA